MKAVINQNPISYKNRKMVSLYAVVYEFENVSKKSDKSSLLFLKERKLFGIFPIVFVLFLFLPLTVVKAQQQFQQSYYSPQPNTNYLRNSNAFRQEIARFEITVHREGKAPLSLSQVPRVNQGDVIKVKLLDEAVNGIKLDQSLYNWTLLVAFINPNRKFSEGQLGTRGEWRKAKGEERGARGENQSSVSEEIQFRKKGWYREHSFTVPYDSQPVFFLYPKPNYRDKILKLVNKNYNEIRKLGEKTIDLAGAYAQIGMFLNELQGVLSGNSYNNNGYGGSYGNSYGSTYGGSYSPYSTYNPYNSYGYNAAYNYNLLVSQSVERIARSFNIQLPNNCWSGNVGYSSTPSYSYGSAVQQPIISSEMVNRLQCVAKNVRLEDFDFSVSKLLQQGGILLAAQLQQKYPQLSYWIGVAALAVDFIVKVFQKTAMRIVPTVTSSSDNPNPNLGGYGGGGGYQPTYSQPNYNNQGYNPNGMNNPAQQPMPKISVFAENQPDDNQFVTAYPLILHKWQAEPDQEVISLRPPVLMESCLHAGVNVLKSTDLTEDQLSDNFTRDYKLMMSSTNGFKKEFPLKKNLGLNGWELNITPQDLQEFPKIQMKLESTISGTRGFNQIKSPPFFLPISIGGSWQITPESQREFTVGGKRTITIKNTLGNCQCLQAVIYKPSFGGQFVFEANDKDHGLNYSPDGKEVSFEVDATNFQPGQGEIELRTFGSEPQKLPLKLYPVPPNITNLKIGKGDREGIISGERLEQLQAIKVNGRRAMVIGNQNSPNGQGYQNPNQPTYNNQATYQNQGVPNSGNQGTSQLGNYVPNLQTSSPNERVFVFEHPTDKLTENTANLELTLEDNRTFQIQSNFPVLPSRPMIVSNELKEIEGVALRDKGQGIRDKSESVMEKNPGIKSKLSGIKNSRPSSLDTLPSATFPIDTTEITLNVQNALTDYDFRVENLVIETRLEKSQVNNPSGFQVQPNPSSNGYTQNNSETSSLKLEFEVLDWKNLRISLQIPEQLQKLFGGRRLQFRIKDKLRGDSDWYSLKQTFVRTPQINSITCTNEMNGMCEMKGATIDYISQVSIDGGQSWYPQGNSGLQVQPTQDGQKLAMIPLLSNKKLLMVKLRDFPHGDGIFINNFNFSSSVKNIKPPGQPNGQLPTQPINPIKNTTKVVKKNP